LVFGLDGLGGVKITLEALESVLRKA